MRNKISSAMLILSVMMVHKQRSKEKLFSSFAGYTSGKEINAGQIEMDRIITGESVSRL